MHGKILYLIADLYDGDEKVKAALEAGVDYVQLREKNITSARYLEDAMHMRRLVDDNNKKFGTVTKLIINDRLDIAAIAGADGVHLGAGDIPVDKARRFLGSGAVIGATAKTPTQALRARADGADYLGTGAFFATSTKPDAKLIDSEAYKSILDAVDIPDLAIGGITTDNCRIPLELGADGLAVSAGILKSGDIKKSIDDFRRIMADY